MKEGGISEGFSECILHCEKVRSLGGDIWEVMALCHVSS